MTLSGLVFSGGVGEVVFNLPELGGYRGALAVGVGATSVRIPLGVEAQVVVRAGIGRVSVEGSFVRDGDRYTTPGFASAPTNARIELTVNGGVGAVTVSRVP